MKAIERTKTIDDVVYKLMGSKSEHITVTTYLADVDDATRTEQMKQQVLKAFAN